MRIQFKEPIAANYLYVDPATNTASVLAPVIGGDSIATDNTCQTLDRLKTFFGCVRGGSGSAFNELKRYERELMYDISLLPQGNEIKAKKEDRLKQIKLYINFLEHMERHAALDSLHGFTATLAFPSFIQDLMRAPHANLNSMLLAPTYQDSFLYTSNQDFSVNRSHGTLYMSLRTKIAAMQAIGHRQLPRDRLLNAVCEDLKQQKDTPVAFGRVKQSILQQTQRLFNAPLPGVEAVNQGGELGLDNLLGVTAESPATLEDYFDGFMNGGASDFFDSISESPFTDHAVVNTTAPGKEKLSILVQFFLATVNMHCRWCRTSQRNFGQVLDADRALSDAISQGVIDALQEGVSVEDKVFGIIEKHAEKFGLAKKFTFTPQAKNDIKKRFHQDWRIVKDSPHFDEFFVLDTSHPGGFVTHKGSIAVNFLSIANQPRFFGLRSQVAGIEQQIQRSDTSYAALTAQTREVPNLNESIVATYEVDDAELTNQILARLLSLEQTPTNAHALVELLFAKTDQDNVHVFQALPREFMSSIRSQRGWPILRQHIAALIKDQHLITAFNNTIRAGDVQLRLTQKMMNAVYIAAIQNDEPSKVANDLKVKQNMIELLQSLGVPADAEILESTAEGDYMLTCTTQDADYLRQLIRDNQDKLYVPQRMAKCIYWAAHQIATEQGRMDEYTEIETKSNQVRPEKMRAALVLLDIPVDDAYFPNDNKSSEGYIFQASDDAFDQLQQLVSGVQRFHLTPLMARCIYQKVNSIPQFQQQLQVLSNERLPDKISRGLTILGIPFSNMTFNGYAGFMVTLDIEMQELIKAMVLKYALANPDEPIVTDNSTVIAEYRQEAEEAIGRVNHTAAPDSLPPSRFRSRGAMPSPGERVRLRDEPRRPTVASEPISLDRYLEGKMAQLDRRFGVMQQFSGLQGGRSRRISLEYMAPPLVQPVRVASSGLTGAGGGRGATLGMDLDTVGGLRRGRLLRQQREEAGPAPVAAPSAAPTAPVAPRIEIQPVIAFQERPSSTQNDRVELQCPRQILEAFQDTLRGSSLLGRPFMNPYRQLEEEFPADIAALTPRHLQLLARNEAVNTTGRMNTHLYRGQLTEEQIGTIRCLVKGTTLSGLVTATHTGGYRSQRRRLIPTQDLILVDQSGFQWQGSLYNTGALFFYPNPHAQLPTGYREWQARMYRTMLNAERRPTPSDDSISVTWQNASGLLDLRQVAFGIEAEFRQAWDATVSQGNINLGQTQPIDFKYLKAGMGFFAEGLHLQGDALGRLELARLKGILHALLNIEGSPNREQLIGKIARLELPFSSLPMHISEELGQRFTETFRRIEETCGRIGLQWGGVNMDDALAPREDFVIATTNCGDPHASIGNEGTANRDDHPSVDASIAGNIPDVQQLNPGVNAAIRVNLKPSYALYRGEAISVGDLSFFASSSSSASSSAPPSGPSPTMRTEP